MNIDNKQYLPAPQHTLKARFAELKSWAAYRHWRSRISRLISDRNVTILECGCGPGFLSKLLKKWFPKATLFFTDYEYVLIKRAKQEVNLSNAFQSDAQKLPVRSETIDLVISFHMIEHLEQPELFLSGANRILKPNGYLIYATPNPDGIGAKIMGDRWSGIRPDHISLLSPQNWHNSTISAGFKLIEHGTTTLSGIPSFQKFPLNILNQGLLLIAGFFPWMRGEAYIGIYQKISSEQIQQPKELEGFQPSIYSVLCCPETHQSLQLATSHQLVTLFTSSEQEGSIALKQPETDIQEALIRSDQQVGYPIQEGIPILLAEKSISVQ